MQFYSHLLVPKLKVTMLHSIPNAECIVEEFHEPPDPCSGIVDDFPKFGTNTTLFTVNLNGIESIGSAVLLTANSYFCGRETLNGNRSDVILCEATIHTSNLSAADTRTEGYFAHFQCLGDATLIPEGPATIVFERNLTSNLSAGCQTLTPSVPFFSYYSGFQIYWRHSGKLAVLAISKHLFREWDSYQHFSLPSVEVFSLKLYFNSLSTSS